MSLNRKIGFLDNALAKTVQYFYTLLTEGSAQQIYPFTNESTVSDFDAVTNRLWTDVPTSSANDIMKEIDQYKITYDYVRANWNDLDKITKMFSNDKSYRKTFSIDDSISLKASFDGYFSLSAYFAKIIKAAPTSVTKFYIKSAGTAENCIEMISAVPLSATTLTLDLDLDLRSDDKPAELIAATPPSVRQLIIKNALFLKCLNSEGITELFKAVPATVIEFVIDLNIVWATRNSLDEIKQIAKILPRSITCFPINLNILSEKCHYSINDVVEEFKKIYAVLPDWISEISFISEDDRWVKENQIGVLWVIMPATPHSVIKLNFGAISGLDADNFKALLTRTPNWVNELVLRRNWSWGGMGPAERIAFGKRVITALPGSAKKFSLNWLSEWADSVERSQIIASTSPWIESLDIHTPNILSKFKPKTVSDFTMMLSAVPATVKELIFSSNSFYQFSTSDIVQIFSAIPSTIEKLDVQESELFFGRSLEERDQILNALVASSPKKDRQIITKNNGESVFARVLLPLLSACKQGKLSLDMFSLILAHLLPVPYGVPDKDVSTFFRPKIKSAIPASVLKQRYIAEGGGLSNAITLFSASNAMQQLEISAAKNKKGASVRTLRHFGF